MAQSTSIKVRFAQKACHGNRGPEWESNPWRSLLGASGWLLVGAGLLFLVYIGVAALVTSAVPLLSVTLLCALFLGVVGMYLLLAASFPNQSRIQTGRRYQP